jgi:hypothetical protein
MLPVCSASLRGLHQGVLLTTSSLAGADQPARFGSGQSVRRLEDDVLRAGAGQFTDDVTLQEQSHLFFVRSP